MWYTCDVCDRDFGSIQAQRQHKDDVGHVWECDRCDDVYYDEWALDRHQEEEGHDGPRYDCEACDVWYDNYTRAKWHMNKEGHWRKHWCQSCQRGFESDNHLKAVSLLMDGSAVELTVESISTAGIIEAPESPAHSASAASRQPQASHIISRLAPVQRLPPSTATHY
jgi:hypothetical protein